MPVKNYFPVFHKLKKGAYSYVWTDKCEKLLPKHYKERCLEYMLTEPKPVHWKPDTRKYRVDEYGNRHMVQNHPIHVMYPVQCNYGLWAGEGTVQCYLRKVRSKKYSDLMSSRIAKFYAPLLIERLLYSEILDKWYRIPCTNRAMDQIDDAFGLDHYILKTEERHINSKLGMDLKRLMLLQLCKDARAENLSEDRQKVFKLYKQYMIPEEEAEWVGLSIQEALEKAENEIQQKKKNPLKELISERFLQELKEYNESDNSEDKVGSGDKMLGTSIQPEAEKAGLAKFASKITKIGKKQ